METEKCPIWGTVARQAWPDRDAVWVDSPRAGGEYYVTGSALPKFESLKDREKAAVTSWLVKQRQFGVSVPSLDSRNVDIILAAPPLTFFERADSVLRYTHYQTEFIGQKLRFRFAEHVVGNQGKNENNMLAWAGAVNLEEVITLLEYCDEMKWASFNLNRLSGLSDLWVQMRAGGYAHLDELRGSNTASYQGFVAMWFDQSMDEIYTEGIAPAIQEAGYSPLRVDKKDHAGRIDDEIIAEIRRSRFLVADFTCAPGQPRGGVYYEAGFAQGRNIPVIWSCRKDIVSELHFDTRQYNHIVWETSVDLKPKLVNRIAAVVGDGPLRIER